LGSVPDPILRVIPIGRVSQGRVRGAADDSWEEAESEIMIDAAWADALEGIEEFSHVWVVWWLDGAENPPDALRVHPQRRQDLPLVGLFATRSPQRPNPIALTAVRLVRREGTTLTVSGLDAFEGSPVLDLKPYLRRGDLIADARQPLWLERVWQER
jgi:tRNA-Thr(GGU) m(6)t(6)A37 methyltransferase TsaA